ncbi:MAG: YezD family protein [Lachnospiraceae bacterium]|nr:YezD family protein [Lachnospiraceae bacterium]
MTDKQTELSEKDYLKVVKQMAEEIKFGTISITVQDGKVVQIEQNKKIRLKN